MCQHELFALIVDFQNCDITHDPMCSCISPRNTNNWVFIHLKGEHVFDSSSTMLQCPLNFGPYEYYSLTLGYFRNSQIVWTSSFSVPFITEAEYKSRILQFYLISSSLTGWILRTNLWFWLVFPHTIDPLPSRQVRDCRSVARLWSGYSCLVWVDFSFMVSNNHMIHKHHSLVYFILSLTKNPRWI